MNLLYGPVSPLMLTVCPVGLRFVAGTRIAAQDFFTSFETIPSQGTVQSL
jgi:hypothetical protein